MAFAPDETTHNAIPTLETPKSAPKGASAYLVVIAGPSFGEMYKMRGDRVILGRGDKTDVRIVDDGVSREHAAVQREGGKIVLVDLGSTNGTFCNGVRVPRQELTDGDKISIGAATILKFTYQDHI
ncbi:MAG TPA: FHA domain-containing protein, partial [Polyangia bacterium]|nr:FHA domain-containing protein [Polyangia bacterium]